MGSFWRRYSARLLLVAVLIVAAIARFTGIGFGLPALRDPDEPMFVLAGLKLLRDHTLNPAWFGHPGTTTIYSLTLLDIAVFGIGHATGRFPDAKSFGLALYHDPSVLLFPSRIMMALGGILCVALTYVLARKLVGKRAGLVAALLLAVNPLHIAYSQLVRTDIQASVFALGAMILAVDAARSGRLKHFLLSGVCAGAAIATKWPAAYCLVAPLGAGAYRMASHPEERTLLIRNMIATMAVAVVSLLAISPFLVLDYPKLLIDLHGEERPRHLGATGDGFGGNLLWYVGSVLPDAMGWPALVAAVGGIAFALRRNRLAIAVLLPAGLIFLTAIAAQKLVWARWMLVLLPVLSVFAAVAVCALADRLGALKGARSGKAALVFLLALLAAPMLVTAHLEATERLHDTRDEMSAWIRANVPPGKTVLVEQFAFDLISPQRKLLFPLGAAGCRDVEELLGGRIRYGKIETERQGQPIVDIGTVVPDQLPSCRADYAILSDYDRYQAEAAHYGPELDNYRKLMAGGQQMAYFAPVRGEVGGPVIRIVRLAPVAAPRTE